MSGWLPYPAASDAAVRLFCLPHAGAGASAFRRWRDVFPPGVDVQPVQLPGREDRIGEPPATDAHALVEELASALAGAADRPFVLFGHSMGALLAAELARRLPPTLLVLSGRAAPVELPPREAELRRVMAATDEEVLGATFDRAGMGAPADA
ncbi:MAG: thioesterase, partial [Saccharothrix sp.]|nr:thioesterase [Saccharothrix sp.]